MSTPQDLGIRQPFYLSTANLALNPATVSEVPFRAETAERMANTFTVIDRPYLFAGAPDVVQKFVWTLAWPSVNSSDYQVFSEMESLPGFFDFCPWKSIVETFSGDGVATTFRLLRRLANVTLSASMPPGVTWTPVVKVGGSPVTPTSFATPDSIGTVLMTLPSAPASAASNTRVTYTPCYYVRVVSPQRDFTIPFNEARTLSLEEI